LPAALNASVAPFARFARRNQFSELDRETRAVIHLVMHVLGVSQHIEDLPLIGALRNLEDPAMLPLQSTHVKVLVNVAILYTRY
jgi:hypothetical protein